MCDLNEEAITFLVTGTIFHTSHTNKKYMVKYKKLQGI